MEMLAALECVDWVVEFEEDTPKEVIDQLLPDILVKGGDYTDITSIAGHESVLANGGEVKILSFIEGHSTTSIIQTIKDKSGN
jgi:D-beta-D-heptose 7-phosphate kinase/D-beta-D-heptose 1-phosphate adenosyltransferase